MREDYIPTLPNCPHLALVDDGAKALDSIIEFADNLSASLDQLDITGFIRAEPQFHTRFIL